MFASIGISRTSSAALVYQLAFDQPTYNALTGEIATVNVLLRETATAGEALRLSSTDPDGLFNVGFRLDYGTSTSGNSATIPDASVSDRVTLNPLLDLALANEQSDSGSILRVFAATMNTNPGIKVTAVGNVAEFYIASIQITASTTPGDVTTLQLADLDTGANTAFLDSFSPDDIGQLGFGSATFTAQAVPEPSSCLALCIGMMSLAGLRSRRRRKVVVDLAKDPSHVTDL